MSKQTQALKLALEALERCVATCFEQYAHEQVMSRPEHFVNQTIIAIREALADSALDRMAENARELGIQMQPEQKPIARLQWADGWTVTLLTGAEDIPSRSGPYALYVGPAPEQQAQQQEPVAWLHTKIEGVAVPHRPADLDKHPDRWTALYPEPKPCPTCEALARTVMMDQTAHDKQRKPLTDEQIMEMYNEPRSDAEMIAFARAIEAAHGIGEQK